MSRKRDFQSSEVSSDESDCTPQDHGEAGREDTVDEEGVSHLQNMYSGVSNLFAACEATNATRPKRQRTEEERKEERLAANRRSARESRDRKKLVFEELQRSVARLAEENAGLKDENQKMKKEMAALKKQLGLLGGTGGGNAVEPVPSGVGQGGALHQQKQLFGGVGMSGGLNYMQQHQQVNNQAGGSATLDQAQQLAMLDAQQQQEFQLAAAAGLNPLGSMGNFLGGAGGSPDQGDSAGQGDIQNGLQGQDGDYQDRLRIFNRRLEERAKLIDQLKGPYGGGGVGGNLQNGAGMGAGGFNPDTIQMQLLQLQQYQGQVQGGPGNSLVSS